MTGNLRPAAAAVARGRQPKPDLQRRIFVLDTNVLMHDPTAIFRFEEHDVYIPMTVLEELDAGKKGLSESARNVRQVSRFLDELMRSATKKPVTWSRIARTRSKKNATASKRLGTRSKKSAIGNRKRATRSRKNATGNRSGSIA